MPRFAALLRACVAGCLFVLPVPALANLSARLIYIREPSAQACPDDADLHAAVRRRIGYEAFYPWAKTTIVVEISREGRGGPEGGATGAYVARVQLADAHGVARGTQELHTAGDCRSAVDAAALAISIALEAEETAQSTPPAPASSAPAQESSEAAPPAAKALPEPTYAPAPAPAAPATESEPAPDVADRPRKYRNAYRVAAGVDGLAALGDAPDAVAGADLWAELRRGIASVGVELQGNIPTTATVSNGDRTNILFFAAVVDPCAHVGGVFFCAIGTFGLMHAEGASNVSVQKQGWAAAVAVGPRAGIEWPLDGALAVRVRGDLLFNVARPGITIHPSDGTADNPWKMPVVGGTLAAGVAYRFP